jgi:hypothetical protein
VETNEQSLNSEILPANVQTQLQELVLAAQTAFASNLKSIILYGSGAEGRLRATSDVNLLFLLSAFVREQADCFCNPIRLSKAAIQTTTMFLLESELELAANVFAVKFSDIARRHKVLFGSDPFTQLELSVEARKQRLRQVLLNLRIRMRERYVITSLREEQLPLIISDVSGPLRAAAVTLLELEGSPTLSPKQALEQVARQLNASEAELVMHTISEARENGTLIAGKAAPTIMKLMELAEGMAERLERMA